MTNTDNYYYDSSVTAVADDTDAFDGIDKTMLFFYAGHGYPEGFSTLGSMASPYNMLLGNNEGEANNGLLRYYWQCSCKVFAHGPKNPADCSCRLGALQKRQQCSPLYDTGWMECFFDAVGHR